VSASSPVHVHVSPHPSAFFLGRNVLSFRADKTPYLIALQSSHKQFSPDFFDLVVVDECHRGSADADAEWRKVLT
jgi:hypothetical protein